MIYDRCTKFMKPNEIMRKSSHGDGITNRKWCEEEVKRMARNGVKATLEEDLRHGVIYVSREGYIAWNDVEEAEEHE